jgi:hypothetical protein
MTRTGPNCVVGSLDPSGAFVAPEDRFDTVLEEVAPIVDSIEFPAP